MFFELDDKFEILRDLKEKYFEFDELAKEKPDKAAGLLDKLIDEYAIVIRRYLTIFQRLLKSTDSKY